MSNKQFDSDNVPMIDEDNLMFDNQNSETFVTEFEPVIDRIVHGEVVEQLVKFYRLIESCSNEHMPPCWRTSARIMIITLSLDDLLKSIQLPQKEHIHYFKTLGGLRDWIKGFGYDPPAKDLAPFYLKITENPDLDPLVLHLIIKMLQKLP